MKKSIIAMSLLLSCIAPAHALDVGDISSFIYSDDAMLSKEIKNTTSNGRLINIKVERITNPNADGRIMPMESRDELLLTPGSVLLPANSTEVIRFYYHGPQDSKERYYRIIWTDQALSAAEPNSSVRNAIATASARISTILVVSPRKVKYDYQYANGKIANTGNATLRIIAYGPCLKHTDGNECKENYFLMPGMSRAFSRVDVASQKGRVATWQADHFMPVK